MAGCPLSPIYMLDILLFSLHLVASIPYLVAPHHGCCLSEALPKLLATNVDGFRVARTRGTMQWTQRFKRRGLNV
jgi:hypothetical protein